MHVYAFTPRKYDPPKFVAETAEELAEKVGEFVGGGQCDGCGNHSYEIRPSDSGNRFVAVCAADPDEDDEFKHPEPCGTVYSIWLKWEEEVEF